MQKTLFLMLILVFLCTPNIFGQETLTISTYYPSPYGSYNELTATSRVAIGDVNRDGNVDSSDLAVDGSGNPQVGSLTVAGNVGIGMTSPQNKLDVKGNSGPFQCPLGVRSNTPAALASYQSLMNMYSFEGSLGSLYYAYSGGTPYVGFDVYNINSASKINFILQLWGGSVGIGTVTPAYKLDVTGDIRATGSVYYGSPAAAYTQPDYVFKNGYRSMTTEEVENYLKREGHLPWMTSSEQERKESGSAVNMTRMGFETVETVENLQLQIITLKKEIDLLKEKLISKR